MAGPLGEALTTALQELLDAGINAAIDPRDLNLPAVWVAIDHVDLNRLSAGAGTITVALHAIAPDSGHPGTLDDLDKLVQDIDRVFPGRSWDPRAVLLASMSPTPLPSLATTITLEWST